MENTNTKTIPAKQITVDEFVNNGIEANVAYTIIKNPTKPIRPMRKLKYMIGDFLERLQLDEYSRSYRKNYRNGITDDLNYNNTLDKCSDTFPVKMIWVDGCSYLMEFKHDEIDRRVEYKVKKLLSENKVGYITDDSSGCYLCCKSEDYSELCKYLRVEYDNDYDNKEYYYNYMFDDILNSIRENYDYSDGDSHKADEKIYEIARHVIVNLDKYADILLSARPYDKDNINEYWINRLWVVANEQSKLNDDM